jgi:hypothetical protein
VPFHILIIHPKPPRSQPKIFQVLVKTHKLTVFLALPSGTTVSVVKEQVLSAFLDDVFKGIHDVPQLSGLDDFVLSREVAERGKDTTSYEVLADDQVLKNVVGNWAVLFVQLKDDSGARDVTVSDQFTGPSFIYLQAEYSRLRSLSLHLRTMKMRCLAHPELQMTWRWTWMRQPKRVASEKVNERR